MKINKFRVWNIEDEDFIKIDDNTFIAFDKNNFQVIEGNEYYGFEYKNVELNQYTTFKDIDKKEIYENDIIETCDGFMKIEFMDGCYMATNKSTNNTLAYYILNDYVKVVGNTYKNKDLLN